MAHESVGHGPVPLGPSPDTPWLTSVPPVSQSPSWSAHWSLTAAVGVWDAPESNWDLALFAVLLAFSVFSYLTAVSTESKVKVSGTFLALVLAMVFLGGTPAALIGVTAMLVGWLVRWRDERHYLLNNLLTYAVFPLLGGIAFHEGVEATRASTAPTPPSTCCVFGLFQFALVINFVMIAGYGCYVERVSVPQQAAGAAAGAAVRVRQRDARRRGRLHLPRDRDRGDRPLRRRPDHLPVPARPAAALPAAGRRAGEAQQAAGQLPGRDVERDAAHARPAGPDDRAALAPRWRATRGRSPSGPASRARRRSSSTSPRCCTTSASSSSPTASSRPTCRSPTRTGC